MKQFEKKMRMQKSHGALQDRGGFVSILMALTLMPLVLATALAIQYGQTSQNQAQLQAIADSSALMATKIAVSEYTQNPNSSYIADGQAAGKKWFVAQASTLGLQTTPSATLTIVRSKLVFNTKLTYQAMQTMIVGSLFSGKQVVINGSSAVTLTAPSYTDFHIMMDNSSSMLIGATQADMNNIAAAIAQPAYQKWDQYSTGIQGLPTCQFACHFGNTVTAQPKPNGSGTMLVTNDFYGVARLIGATLRLDVVTSAVSSMINTIATDQKGSQSQYQVALYAFDDPSKSDVSGSPTGGNADPVTLYPLGNNFTSASTIATSLQSPYTPNFGPMEDDTDITSAINYLNEKIPQSSNIGSSSNHQEILVLITDGVNDIDSNGTQVLGPIDPTACTTLKDRGVQIYILYTTYYPLLNNPSNWNKISQFVSNGPPSTMLNNMDSCASGPNNVYSATSTADIQTQLKNLLNDAINKGGRFTQ